MANIAPVVNRDISESGNVILVTWSLLTTGDVGLPFRLGKYSLSTFQVYGTTVTAVALQGSNDVTAPTNFAALRDWTGGSLGALSAAGLYSPRDMPLWVAPTLTTGSTVTVAAAFHRQDINVAG